MSRGSRHDGTTPKTCVRKKEGKSLHGKTGRAKAWKNKEGLRVAGCKGKHRSESRAMREKMGWENVRLNPVRGELGRRILQRS